MVFESLMDAKEVRKSPAKMFFLGIIYSSLGIIVSKLIFYNDPSLSMVFLSTMACLPLLIKIFKIEETEDFTKKEYPLIGNHIDVFWIMFFLFLGFLVSYTTWYIILPDSEKVFSTQIRTIESINTPIQGNFSEPDLLELILVNNFKVLFFCILFSFLYGAGAIFIICWNASVMGTAIGNAIKLSIPYLHLAAIPLGFGKYLLHGIPELAAYLIAGIAGGIISVAVIRHKVFSKKFMLVLFDSIDLIILSSIILILSAYIEVYISMVI